MALGRERPELPTPAAVEHASECTTLALLHQPDPSTLASTTGNALHKRLLHLVPLTGLNHSQSLLLSAGPKHGHWSSMHSSMDMVSYATMHVAMGGAQIPAAARNCTHRTLVFSQPTSSHMRSRVLVTASLYLCRLVAALAVKPACCRCCQQLTMPAYQHICCSVARHQQQHLVSLVGVIHCSEAVSDSVGKVNNSLWWRQAGQLWCPH